MKKKLAAAFFIGWTINGVIANWVIKRQDKRFNELLTIAKIEHKALMMYVENGPEELTDRVREEVAFDLIVKDM